MGRLTKGWHPEMRRVTEVKVGERITPFDAIALKEEGIEITSTEKYTHPITLQEVVDISAGHRKKCFSVQSIIKIFVFGNYFKVPRHKWLGFNQNLHQTNV